jgi:hypothetical protein
MAPPEAAVGVTIVVDLMTLPAEVKVRTETDPALLLTTTLEVEAAALELAAEEDRGLAPQLDTFLHLRSYRGFVLAPSIPPATENEGEAPSSFRMYHQKLMQRDSSSQAISCQNLAAFSMLGTAWSSSLPLTGHPVSVTQRGLPPATASTLL